MLYDMICHNYYQQKTLIFTGQSYVSICCSSWPDHLQAGNKIYYIAQLLSVPKRWPTACKFTDFTLGDILK